MKCSVCGKRAHAMKGMVSYHDPSGKLQHAHKKCKPGQSKKPSPIKIPLITRHEKTAKNEEPVKEEAAEAEGEHKNRRARRIKPSE